MPGSSGKDQRLLISNIMQNSTGPFNNAMGGSSAQTGQQPSGSSQAQPSHAGEHHQKQMLPQPSYQQQALDQVQSTEV